MTKLFRPHILGNDQVKLVVLQMAVGIERHFIDCISHKYQFHFMFTVISLGASK